MPARPLTGSGGNCTNPAGRNAGTAVGRAGGCGQAKPQGALSRQWGSASSQHRSQGGTVLSAAPRTLAIAAGNADPYGPPVRNAAATSSIARMRLARVMAGILLPRRGDAGNFAGNPRGWNPADLMPVVPLFGFDVGVSPLMQWFAVSVLALQLGPSRRCGTMDACAGVRGMTVEGLLSTTLALLPEAERERRGSL